MKTYFKSAVLKRFSQENVIRRNVLVGFISTSSKKVENFYPSKKNRAVALTAKNEALEKRHKLPKAQKLFQCYSLYV